jgi:hypothetical protein
VGAFAGRHDTQFLRKAAFELNFSCSLSQAGDISLGDYDSYEEKLTQRIVVSPHKDARQSTTNS